MRVGASNSASRPGQPAFLAAAHGDVDAVAREIDQRVGSVDAHGEMGLVHLEAADARRQPEMREAVAAAHRQHARIVLRERREAAAHLVEGAHNHGGERLARRRQLDAPPDPVEQAGAGALLKQLDLIADRCLGHAQLACSFGEIEQARGGLEGADGGKRRERRGHLST